MQPGFSELFSLSIHVVFVVQHTNLSACLAQCYSSEGKKNHLLLVNPQGRFVGVELADTVHEDQVMCC